MDGSQFVDSHVDGHLDCFQFLAITKKAVNIYTGHEDVPIGFFLKVLYFYLLSLGLHPLNL